MPPRSHIHHVDPLPSFRPEHQQQPQPQSQPPLQSSSSSSSFTLPSPCPHSQSQSQSHTPTTCQTCTSSLETAITQRILKNLHQPNSTWTPYEIEQITPFLSSSSSSSSGGGLSRRSVGEMKSQGTQGSEGIDRDYELQLQLLEEFNFRLRLVRRVKEKLEENKKEEGENGSARMRECVERVIQEENQT